MTVVEWHPDELLDKRRSGRLSARERAGLEEHLDRCVACRIEALAIEDFAHELEQDDERASGRLARLVGAAVAERVAPPQPRRKLVAVVAAAVALSIAGSAAALYTVARRAPIERVAPAFDALVARARPAPRAAVPPEKATPRAAASDDPAAPQLAAPSAAALFASANQARRAGRRAEALRLYRELERRHPESPEAKLSHAIVGRMLLDEGNPDAALGEFDRYLGEGQGTLSEEALVGRALALQKLGRSAEERAAWQALLQHYPSSIHAARARARLAALGGG